jgi:hypothetical protein
MGLEGIVSKRADAPYAPGNRGLWVKVKCLHREEFVVVGWTDPEGSRPWLGALLLAYYDPDGRLVYAGRVGTGIKQAELERLWRRLQPLATSNMPLEVPPPRTSRFGSPLVLSRVHWVRPELVADVKYLTWTDDNLLRQVVYEGVREDKPAAEVHRRAPPETRGSDAPGWPVKTASLRLSGSGVRHAPPYQAPMSTNETRWAVIRQRGALQPCCHGSRKARQWCSPTVKSGECRSNDLNRQPVGMRKVMLCFSNLDECRGGKSPTVSTIQTIQRMRPQVAASFPVLWRLIALVIAFAVAPTVAFAQGRDHDHNRVHVADSIVGSWVVQVFPNSPGPPPLKNLFTCTEDGSTINTDPTFGTGHGI